MTASICNLAGYQFIPLGDLPQLRVLFQKACQELSLKGTLLLSPEGFNCFMAGLKEDTERFEALIREHLSPSFDKFKRSFSTNVPFKRLLVKIKKEIIAFGQEGVDPYTKPAPFVDALTLKQWLDQKEPVIILDTRNDYECRLGHFKHSVILSQLHHFRDFPSFIQEQGALLKEQWKGHKIVTVCTGGIRCEKAAPYLIQQGFEQVYQLADGILAYFETIGSAHYEGDCFVFDYRVALDPQLQPSGARVCFACRMPVTIEEQASPAYIIGQSCPACATSSCP